MIRAKNYSNGESFSESVDKGFTESNFSYICKVIQSGKFGNRIELKNKVL